MANEQPNAHMSQATRKAAPSCGATAAPLLQHSKLAVCNFCNSTLFVNDAQVQSAGEKSVLSDIPSILAMGAASGSVIGHSNQSAEFATSTAAATGTSGGSC
jgi:hypothetical protein